MGAGHKALQARPVLVTHKQVLHTPRVACVFDTRAVCAAEQGGRAPRSCVALWTALQGGLVRFEASFCDSGRGKQALLRRDYAPACYHTVAAVSVWANALGRGAALLS